MRPRVHVASVEQIEADLERLFKQLPAKSGPVSAEQYKKIVRAMGLVPRRRRLPKIRVIPTART